jgi:subtilisin family serine protease
MSQNDVGLYRYTRFRSRGGLPEIPTRIALVRREDIDDDKLNEANETLAAIGSKWILRPESGTQPFVVALRMHYKPDRRPSRTPEVALSHLHAMPAWLDPMLLGAVAYRPHALTRGDLGRVPVSVQMPAPERAEPAGRRRVVALLDTAVADHPWWVGDPADDRFCVNAGDLNPPWDPGTRLDPPETSGKRELAEQEGHGTFCAGLIRQIAPDARVLAIHVMADDGTVYGDHILNALQWLADSRAVVRGDVVCLPVGFHPILPADQRYLDWLAEVLGVLAQGGVTVVASAGNEGGEEPVYPAAFAASKTPEEFRLRSVGAINVPGDRGRAYYSNGGAWVTHWEVGTSLISTFPPVNAAASAEFNLRAGSRRRRSPDPDDFSGGFARWSGTSFAAAVHAAKVAIGEA